MTDTGGELHQQLNKAMKEIQDRFPEVGLVLIGLTAESDGTIATLAYNMETEVVECALDDVLEGLSAGAYDVVPGKKTIN